MVSRMLRFFPPVVTGTIIARHRHQPDARGHQLDLRQPGRPDGAARWSTRCTRSGWPTSRRPARRCRPACPRACRSCRRCRTRRTPDLGGIGIAALVLVSILLIVKYAKGFIANISVLLGIVDRRRRRGRARLHDLREGRQGRLVRHRAALPLRHAAVRPGPDPHDVADHDRGDDRIDRHVPRARRDDRNARSPSRTWRAACAPTASAR